MCNEAPGTRQLLSLCSRPLSLSLSPLSSLATSHTRSLSTACTTFGFHHGWSRFARAHVPRAPHPIHHPHVHASRYPVDILRTSAFSVRVPNKIFISDISNSVNHAWTISDKTCSVTWQFSPGTLNGTDECILINITELKLPFPCSWPNKAWRYVHPDTICVRTDGTFINARYLYSNGAPYYDEVVPSIKIARHASDE